MCLIHGNLLYLFFRTLYFGRECSVRYRLYLLYFVGNYVCICNNYFSGLFLSQVIEFSEHFLCCSEIEWRLFFRIIKSLGIHKYFTVYRVLGVYEMAVACGNNQLIMFFSKSDYLSVELLYILYGIYSGYPVRIYHEHIVSYRLYFQIVIEIHNIINVFFRTHIKQRSVEFTCFTGTAYNKTFPVLHKFALGYSRLFMIILKMRH